MTSKHVDNANRAALSRAKANGHNGEAISSKEPVAVPQERPLKFRDEVAQLKRDRIVDTAADLFYEHGYANTTLDAVAEQMGFSKAFIYSNFSSKPELLVEICIRGVAHVHEAVEGALNLRLDTRTTLALVVERYVSSVLKYQKYIAVYTREEKSLPADEAIRANEKRRQFFSMIADFIERGRDEGVFKSDDPLLSALTLGGSVTWMAFWYREGGRLQPHEIASNITRSTMLMLGAADADK
ncbi:TetR/AcrR family transcriptional regulator [Maritimibacter alexandrii]|jgi:AcrR family transcriptional regulator|uniref:TetR/AcrR family transcriptional regulator n=1 Tax=Maritimibacter alexandrii TaxID=2570355 RepID=UPI001109DB21|nr:TetR/AcrR family transcriptional regulator [Maritimibacter alexandrii]